MQMNHDQQAQAAILQRNVSAIAEMQHRETSQRTFQDHIAAALTDFSGSMAFVYIHALWFAIWFVLNLGIFHIPGITGFDPYPFGLLTLIVSLEAIFLSTFVLIAQNNLSAVSDKRAELDLHVNLLAEQKSAKILELLDKIGDRENHPLMGLLDIVTIFVRDYEGRNVEMPDAEPSAVLRLLMEQHAQFMAARYTVHYIHEQDIMVDGHADFFEDGGALELCGGHFIMAGAQGNA